MFCRSVIVIAALASAALAAAPAQAAEHWVYIYSWGTSPAELAVDRGDTVHFTNASGQERRIVDTGGLLDSGPFPAGGGYSVAITAPGEREYTTTGVFGGSVTARIRVRVSELAGPPGAPVAEHIPDLPFPGTEAAEVSLHPEFAIYASRIQILVGFADGATVAQANAALATANVEIRGGIPEFGILLVAVRDAGWFGPLEAALASLRASPAVRFASMSPELEEEAVPKTAEPALETFVDPRSGRPMPWKWEVVKAPGGGPGGQGGNWGLEASRFPQAWNLLDAVRERQTRDARARVHTGIVDAGFDAGHDDLSKLDYRQLCVGSGAAKRCTQKPQNDHGTHVAGIIGADYDNEASGGRTKGVSGANPVALMDGVSAFVKPASAGWSDMFHAWRALLTNAAPPDQKIPDLRVVNFSMGVSGWKFQPLGGVRFRNLWWSSHPTPNCGPLEVGDDGMAGSNQWCTPENDDRWNLSARAWGNAALQVADAAASQRVTIVQAAGNDSDKFCIPGPGKQPIPDADLPCTAAGATLVQIKAMRTAPFAWASRHWASSRPNPIIIVENIDQSLARNASSNVAGDISAPGTDILSTISGGRYATMSGTSMAAPQIAGLVGYLLAFESTLTPDQVLSRLLAWSRTEANAGGSSPRVDAFATVLASPGAAKALVDVNDRSLDGRRRVVLDAENKVSGVDDKPITPDERIDMRDFRVYRDALLQTCEGAARPASCPAGKIALNGVLTNRKRDLNVDGCVVPPGGTDPKCGNPVGENVFPRFDFNGDGVIDRIASDSVPLKADGTPAPTAADATSMTDLEVLASQFADTGEGWTKDKLPRLLESGDLELHADKLFEDGVTSVDFTFSAADGTAIPPRTLKPAADAKKQFVVATVPAGTDVTVDAVARRGPLRTSAITETLKLELGEDRRLDACRALSLSARPATIPADGLTTTSLVARVAKCRGSDIVAAKPISWKVEPASGTTLDPAPAQTDSNGSAVALLKGTQTGTVRVTATADLGGGRTASAEVDIQLGKALQVRYLWKQTVEDWWEEGSTDWPDELVTASSPDCESAPVAEVPFCIDSFRIELGGEPGDSVVRSGTLSGSGERFRVSQTVEDTPTVSKAQWVVTSRRDGREYPGGRTVTQRVSDPDRYADHPLGDGEVAAVEAGDRLYVYGMQWVGDLPYHYDPHAVLTPGTSFVPQEIHAAPDRLTLVPQDPSIRFAGAPETPMVFAQTGAEGFAQFQSCGLYDRDISHEQPQWYEPWGDQWGGVAGRTSVYLPGERPMPIGPGHLRIRYTFAAVAWYEGDEPRTPALPDCTVNLPPAAAFDAPPAAALEGRQVHFVDRSLDAENGISEWEWDFGDGETSAEPSPHHMFPDDGTYSVRMTVRDADGQADTVTQEVTVANVAPEASIDDVDTFAGQETVVEFQMVDASKIDKAELRYRLESPNPNWPAGTAGTEEAGARRIRFPGAGLPEGTYPLRLTVTDKEGAAAVAEAFVVVASAPPGPCDPVTGENCPVTTPLLEFATCAEGVTLDEEEHQFLILLNAYRVENGLVPVAVSPTLSSAAELHAHDMAASGFLGHTGSDGSSPWQRAWGQGYPERQSVGENVAGGTATGFASLQAWKGSQTGHNENMLDPAWRAIGIARERGDAWRWATSFGKVLDCPALEVDTTPAEPGEDGEPTVFASTLATPLTHAPLAALTIENLQPRAKSNVVFHNRSRDGNGLPVAATLGVGDGSAPVVLGPDETYVHRYTTPYSKTATLTAADADGRERTVTRSLSVTPLPTPFLNIQCCVLQGLAGKTLDVRATATYGPPVPGLELRFELEGQSVVATTGADGIASATLSLAGLSAGSYSVVVTFAGSDDWNATSTSRSLQVTQNIPPVPDAGGAYVIAAERALLLDGTRSTEPDAAAGDRIVSYEWDLDGDGTFGDTTGAMPAPLVWDEVQSLVCGGVCFTDASYTLGLKATDVRGDSAVATTTARFTSDFALTLGGEGKTIVPGASNSFGVSVVGGGGYTSPVMLSVSGLPAGVTASFSVNPVTPSGLSVLTISAGSAVGDGTFPIVVSGTSNGVTHTVSDEIDVAFGLIPVCRGSFTGIVRDKTTGVPMAGAEVNGSSLSSVTTDANGRYRIDNVQLGTNNAPRSYLVQAHKSGYWSALVSATAACGAPVSVDLQPLPQQLGRLGGSVVLGIPDPANHNFGRAVSRTSTPLAGVTISAVGPGPLTTSADGRYEGGFSLNTGNTPRSHQVTASLPGHWPQTKPITLDALTTKALDFELVEQCYGRIRGGVVRWADTGEVVPAAGVEWRFSALDRGTMLTNASGAYDFDKSHLLGVNNAIGFFTLKATPPLGSPPGSAGLTANVSLADCGSETGADLLITRPKVNRATLEGYVRDQDTSAPLPLAWVSYGTITTQADGNGFYRFADILIGFDAQTTMNGLLSASVPGYYSASFSQTITAGSIHAVDVRLLRIKYASATGVVKDKVTGTPIPEAEVGCWDPAFCTHTGRDGRYNGTEIVLGTGNTPITRTIRASADGYWLQNKSLKFEAEKTTASDFELLRQCPTARISGTVVSAETQAPIMGAWVRGGDRSDFSDELGRFELEDVVPGSGNGPLGVQITASASGFFTAWKDVTIFCGANVTVDFGARQNASGSIVGKVTNADTGLPMTNVFVGSEFGGTAKTDAAGNYRIDGVPLGDLDTDREWEVSVVPSGFKQQSRTVVARAGVAVRADFAFTAFGNNAPSADPQTVQIDEDYGIDLALTGGDLDGDVLEYHVMRHPEHGRLYGSPPNVHYRPDTDFNGADSFAFATHDGLVLSAEATVDVVVSPGNDNPFALSDSFTADEETPLVIPVADLLANDVDVDGDVLLLDTFTKSDARFTLTRLGDTLLLTPLAGLTGTVFFSYSVADGNGGYASTWAQVTVRDVPGAPLCGDRLLSGARNTPLVDVLACTDRDGDVLTYTLVEGPQHGAVALAAGGGFTYTPADGFLGDDSFTFTASDGTLAGRVATVHLTIVNHAPQASDASVTVDEDTTAAVTLAAADADGDPLLYTVAAAPEHGTLSGEAPDLTYTPEPGFFGADSFTFVATDGIDPSEPATVAIDVEPVNDAAAAGDDTAATGEDEPLTIPALDNDTVGAGDDGQTLVVAAIAQPAHGTVFAIAGGSVFYAPEADWSGTDAFSYLVCDDGSPVSCATGNVAVSVAPANDRPSAAAARVTVEEDAAPLAIDLADFASDSETGDPDLTYTVVSRPRLGSLSGSGRMLAYDSDDDVEGRDSFTFRVTDRGDPDACPLLPACSPPLTSSLRTVTIAIAAVNDPPAVELVAPTTLPLDATAQLAAVGTDVDGDLLTYAWSADGGTLDTAGAGATLATAVPATINVTVTVSDGQSEATAGGAIVFASSRPVVAAGADAAIEEGDTVTLAASFSDPGDDVHTVSVDWGDGTAPASALDASHAYADDGVYTVTVRVADDDGGVGEDTLEVRVANVAPAVDAGADVTIDEGSALVSSASFADPGADTHVISVDWGDGTPAVGALDSSHVYADDGSYTVTVLVTDDDGGVGEDTRTVTVRNVSPAVDAGLDQGADEASAVTLAATYVDPGAVDTHTVAVDWGDGTAGAALGDSHAYVDDGTYTVTVTVADDDGGTGSDTLSVTVRNVAPTVEAGDDAAIDEGGSVTLAASLSDPGSADTHAVAVDWGDGAGGSGLTGGHRYDDNGTYSVVVTARDDDGGVGADRFRVAVRNVVPTVDAGPDRTAGWGVKVPLSGVAFDPSDADTAAGFTGGWRFGDGGETSNLAALHAYEVPGSYEAVLTVADKDGGSASDSVTVTIGKRATQLVYTGPVTAPFGSTILSARLEDAVDAPSARLAGRPIAFTLNGTAYTALTDSTGSAAVAARVTGGEVTVEFAGDDLYLQARTQEQLNVTYSFGGGGFFAIGDGNVAPAAEVTFWGSQWWTENDEGVAAFKGWVARDAAPACGGRWTTGTGNSASPPASVPRYLAVVVTANVAKAGSAVTGDTAGIVVVETHAGYAGAPGHTGTGTVVARVC